MARSSPSPRPPPQRRRLARLGLVALTLLGGALPRLLVAQTPTGSGAPTSPPAVRATLLVIANADFAARQLSRGELAALFLRARNTLADETPVQVIDASDAALREAFFQAIAGRSPAQMHAYWSRMVFSGAARPPLQLDSAALVAQLRTDTGTIGYVAATIDPRELRGLRVVATLELR